MICIAGKNDIAINVLEHILNENFFEKKHIFGVCCKLDSGTDSWQKSLKNYLQNNNISILALEQTYEFRSPFVFLSLEFDTIINPNKFNTDRLFNIHFSLLPQYKGMYTSTLPILHNEHYSGVTFHKIDSGIDTGDIIKQRKFEIDYTWTARDLYFKYLSEGTLLATECLKLILDNKEIHSYPQPINYSSYYSKKSINYLNIEIDFNKCTYEIYNQLRAFIFKEYQLPQICNCRIESVELLSENMRSNDRKSSVVDCGDFFIITGVDGYKLKANKEITNN